MNNTISTLFPEMYPSMTAGTLMIGLTITSTVAAAVLLVVTRGRLGYDPARRALPIDAPVPARTRLVGSHDGLR